MVKYIRFVKFVLCLYANFISCSFYYSVKNALVAPLKIRFL